MVGFIQGNWKKRGDRPVDYSWTGKTFRLFGPCDIDYEVEASEVREALTDFDLLCKRRWVTTWYHFFLLLAFVVSWCVCRGQPSYYPNP